jgi:hypothetical protein
MLAVGQLCEYQIIIQYFSSGRFARISAMWLWPVSLVSILGEDDQARRVYLRTKYDSQNKYRLFPLVELRDSSV